MKSDRKILIAFLLNFFFAIFEFVGGIITGSIAILSDALHDLGDAAGIGVAYFLERKSKRQPDNVYTYGYARYSVLGSAITLLILLIGSCIVIYNAIHRLIFPVEIHYDGMILFALVGALVNLIAAKFTSHGDSMNQKAVNLHMLEDVLGWLVVLVGAIIMRLTDIRILDPLLSMGVAIFILVNAAKGMGQVLNIFLDKMPENVHLSEIQEHICHIEGVQDVHHIHIWTTDGIHLYATAHIVTDSEPAAIKAAVREELKEHGIGHATLELETSRESCQETLCHVEHEDHHGHHHQHHGHHHHHH